MMVERGNHGYFGPLVYSGTQRLRTPPFSSRENVQITPGVCPQAEVVNST